MAYRMCLLGATDRELAATFDVAESTLNLWKLKHRKFSESIKEGKEVANAAVAESLYKRAMGYDAPEDKFIVVDGELEIHATKKHYPPDTTACIFFLKNRAPEKWRDVHRLEHTGKVGTEVAESSVDDLRAELAKRGLTSPVLTRSLIIKK